MQRRVVTISYDFAGTTIRDPALMGGKFVRDGYGPDTSLLVTAWSSVRQTIPLSSQITVESLPAFLGGFRPLYDLFSIIVVPYVLKRRREKPDMIVVQDFPLLWAAYATHLMIGGEVVLRLTNLPEDLARTRGMFHRWYHRMNEVCAKGLADRFIVINETTRAYCLKLGIPASRITIAIPNTILADAAYSAAAKKGEIRRRYGIPAEVPIVLSVGRLEKEKGFDELIDLFATLPFDARLVIVGSGVLQGPLETRARERAIAEKIIFAGRQEHSMLWNYYADADVFVLLSRSEALGLVFWEAMYMRVPVIGRPVGGIKETIGEDGERGFFWDTQDRPEAFKAKLLRCVKKDKEVALMIERARTYVDGKITP